MDGTTAVLIVAALGVGLALGYLVAQLAGRARQ